MSNRISPLFSVAMLLPTVASHAATDESMQTLEPVVVTASRMAQPLKAVIGDVTVIDRQTLERFSGESVLSALQGQVGVQIASNGGAGKTSAVFLRGGNSSHTLVLIDGVRYGSATGGAAALEHIPTDQVERIEVLRGAAASLYGSDAIGGVIQIFTRQGKETAQASLQVGYGSQDSRQASVNLSGKQGNTRASITVAHQQTDNTSAVRNQNGYGYYPDDDGYQNTSISTKISHELNNQHQLGVTLLAAQSTNHYDGAYSDENFQTGAQSYDYRGKHRNGAAHMWSKHQWNDYLSSEIKIGESQDKNKNFSASGLQDYRDSISRFDTTQRQYSLSHQADLSVGIFQMVLERLQQKVVSTTAFKQDQREIDSAQLGYFLHADRFGLQANLRHDDNSQFGQKTTYLFGASTQPVSGLTLGANTGTGFHAPTFNELYWPVDTYFQGNPNLKPETSRSHEVFATLNKAQHELKLTVFQNRVKNLLTYQFPTTVNIGKAQLEGFSLTGKLTDRQLQTGFSYDYLDATDQSGLDNDGRQLARRAKHSGMVYLGLIEGNVQARAEVQAVGSRYDNAANTTRLAKYTLVNVSGSVKVNPELSLGLRINNLFDENYEAIRNYGTLGINGMLTLTYSPKF